MQGDEQHQLMRHMVESNLEMQRELSRHSDRIGDVVAGLMRIDERLKSFVDAADRRDNEHSERINSAASEAALSATKLADWESKIKLLIWLVSLFGIGGILSFISVVTKGML